MYQRRTVGAELTFDAIESQHCLALPLGDRLTCLPAVDIFPCRIDRARAALGLLPIILKGAPALILRFVDLAMRMQTTERIIADRTQRHDLVARFQRKGIIDLDGRDLRISWQIPGSAVMRPGGIVGLLRLVLGTLMSPRRK